MNNQEAIDLLDNLIGMISDNQDSDYDEALEMAISALSENKGEWIKDSLDMVVCSNCGEWRRDNRIKHINFCNCCGADMRGKQNE